jgi:hypothetical protein
LRDGGDHVQLGSYANIDDQRRRHAMRSSCHLD